MRPPPPPSPPTCAPPAAGWCRRRWTAHPAGYVDPHTGPGHLAPQPYLPEQMEGRILYRPTRQGREAGIADRLEEWDMVLGRPTRSIPDQPDDQ